MIKRGEGRVYPHGNWWWVDIQFKGKRFRERVIHISAPKAEKTAKAILAKKRVEIAERQFLNKTQEVKMTFSELANKYMEEYAKKRKKSWKTTDRCYLVHLNKAFGNMDIKEITREDVLRYQIKRQVEVSASSVNHEVSLLRAIYNMAIHVWDHPSDKTKPLFGGRNPAMMRKIGYLQRLNETPRDRYMTRGELLRFLEAADSELVDYTIVAVTTGLRKGELQGLSDKKVDLENDLVKLEASDTKTAKMRYVPLCKIARAAIERRNLDFSKDIMRTNGKYPFGKALKTAKIENFHWHDFRRTFSTYLEECGVSAERRRRIMGHSDHKMTETYTRIELEQLRSEISKLDEYLREVPPFDRISGTGAHNSVEFARSKSHLNIGK